jgi:hypothetical protein
MGLRLGSARYDRAAGGVDFRLASHLEGKSVRHKIIRRRGLHPGKEERQFLHLGAGKRSPKCFQYAEQDFSAVVHGAKVREMGVGASISEMLKCEKAA